MKFCFFARENDAVTFREFFYKLPLSIRLKKRMYSAVIHNRDLLSVVDSPCQIKLPEYRLQFEVRATRNASQMITQYSTYVVSAQCHVIELGQADD